MNSKKRNLRFFVCIESDEQVNEHVSITIRCMPTIKEILQEERNRPSDCVVMFLEGKFWKAYEQSAYTLTKLYNFKPTKRFVKLVGEEIISVGFPQEQLLKYLGTPTFEAEGKRCRAKA